MYVVLLSLWRRGGSRAETAICTIDISSSLWLLLLLECSVYVLYYYLYENDVFMN